jgi:hypothetical protein
VPRVAEVAVQPAGRLRADAVGGVVIAGHQGAGVALQQFADVAKVVASVEDVVCAGRALFAVAVVPAFLVRRRVLAIDDLQPFPHELLVRLDSHRRGRFLDDPHATTERIIHEFHPAHWRACHGDQPVFRVPFIAGYAVREHVPVRVVLEADGINVRDVHPDGLLQHLRHEARRRVLRRLEREIVLPGGRVHFLPPLRAARGWLAVVEHLRGLVGDLHLALGVHRAAKFHFSADDLLDELVESIRLPRPHTAAALLARAVASVVVGVVVLTTRS